MDKFYDLAGNIRDNAKARAMIQVIEAHQDKVIVFTKFIRTLEYICYALKDRGIKVAVLYTTYLPIPTDAIWNQAINPVFAKNIGPNLKACATEGLFFEVKPTDDMAASMSALFSKAASATSGLRLTN